MVEKTFIIAEAGLNHDGSEARARELIKSAKECGCNAVKFQTYFADKRSSPGSPIYDILKKCELSFEQQKRLKDFANNEGIEFFSTPFDTESLKFLVEELNLRRIKIASFDATNREFLKAVNEYGKQYPVFNVIMSTGMSHGYEIFQSLECFKDVPYLTLLHCVSAYPTPEKEVNLSAIKTLKHLVSGPRKVGYSDHTDDIFVPAAAVLAGACVIEKHFILDKNGPGCDAPVSADPHMMKCMVELIRKYEDILGSGELKPRDIEQGSLQFRRVS